MFWGTDASILNLEGAITNGPIEDILASGGLTFKFSPQIVKTLSFLRVNGASLANNHSNNAGREGLELTRSLLPVAGIKTFGGPTDSGVSEVAWFEGEGMRLAVIGINLTFPGQTADVAVPIIEGIKKDPNARVLVMPHWGVEYATKHSPAQAGAAHMWIDAGADIVIGAHPHVVQDAELYKGRPIIYSLGNFLFDQYQPGTKNGLLVAGKFTKDGLMFFGLPTQITQLKPELVRGEAKTKVLDALYAPFAQYVVETPLGTHIQLPY